MPLSLPKRVVKKTGDQYIVWFGESNQWVQLEEPAYFVYQQSSLGLDAPAISRKCCRRYGLPEKESLRFVQEVLASVAGFTRSSPFVSDPVPGILVPDNFPFTPAVKHTYCMNGQPVEIAFESILLGYYFHPFLAHLETTPAKDPGLYLAVFRSEERFVLRSSARASKCLLFNDVYQLKRRLFIDIINTLYHREDGDWMSFVHASAVTNGEQTLLLSSASGSGKSTMAALLQSRGLQIVSDDFVPIDTRTKRAWPFPAAISIKKGTFPLLDSLKGIPEAVAYEYRDLKNSGIRLLPVEVKDKSWYRPHPVQGIVFLKYRKGASFRFSSLPVTDALKLFHEQACVFPTPKNARQFINWFLKLNCYRLEYDDTEKAVKKLTSLIHA